jgi:hypothetical protein
MSARAFTLLVAPLLVAPLLAALPLEASAQHEYGDGVGIGGVLLPSDSATLLGISRFGESLGLELALSLDVMDDDSTTYSDIGAGLGVKRYLSPRKQFQPFVGGRFAVEHHSHDDGHVDVEDTQFGVAVMLGGEYFVTRQISFEGEMNFGMSFGSFHLRTGTRLSALFYL